MCVDDELLSTYLDGELGEPWRTQVGEHLQYCAACRGRLGQLEALHHRLQSVALTDSEMKGSKERVMAFFEATKFPAPEQKRHLWRRTFELKLGPTLLSAAAFVVVVIGAFILFSPDTPQGQEILPGVVAPIDSEHIRQVTDLAKPDLGMFSLEQIIQHLDALGYSVKIEMKAVTPIE
ncbi:MAG: zf-HC2 domain-containing protein [Sphaerochaeta sp.]|jgi:anti-sigma factor RsiW|nr:zf-HC2 domain-containing protein [Sphaerochaeta sp.]MDX9914461.1 zf-HC2 domain-containing protein [Sphaerochaeta sp.]